MHWQEAWEAGLVFADYWLPQRKAISDRYLPSLREEFALAGKHPVWYVGMLALNAGQTGRLRISVDPGFALTAITGQSSVAGPADGLGAAGAQIYDTAQRTRFQDRPIVQSLIFGTASDPFLLINPYTWTSTAPVLIVLVNRNLAASNTIYIVLHGWRDR